MPPVEDLRYSLHLRWYSVWPTTTPQIAIRGARIRAVIPDYPPVLAHRRSLCSGCSAERDKDETD